MATISGAVRRPTEAPADDWFAQNGFQPSAPAVNTTMPVGDRPVLQTGTPVGNDVRLQPQGGPVTPELVRAFVSQYPATYEGAQAADAAGRAAYGAAWPQLLDHPTKLDKWQFPDGSVYDLMNSAGGPGASWVSHATPEVHGGPSGGGGAPASGSLGALGGMMSGTGGQIPFLNPSIDFGLGKVQQGLERGAAAKGTLLTGGFQNKLGRELYDYAQLVGWDPAFNKNYQVAGLGLDATRLGAQNSTSYMNNATDAITNQGGANANSAIDRANNWSGTIGGLANIWSQYPWGGR